MLSGDLRQISSGNRLCSKCEASGNHLLVGIKQIQEAVTSVTQEQKLEEMAAWDETQASTQKFGTK